MTIDEANPDWAREFLELEGDKPSEVEVRKQKKMATGDRPDMFVTLLGAVLGGGLLGILWFLGVNYDIYESSWTAVAVAAGIVFGAKFGINKPGSLLLVTSVTTYVITIVITLSAIVYNQYNSIRQNPWAFRKIENIILDNYFDDLEALIPFAAGGLFILVSTTVFGRKRF